MKNELSRLVGEKEKVFWQGKPRFICFLLESIFNPMLPIAIIWTILDFSILGKAISSDMGIFVGAFMLLHLMPLWIYLSGALFSLWRWKNIEYVITDRGIYFSSGILSKKQEFKPFTDLSHITMHRGLIDRLCSAGDIQFKCAGMVNSKGQAIPLTITSIKDYESVFKMAKTLQTDIYSDTMYPNDLRPKENHGYRTEYKGDI